MICLDTSVLIDFYRKKEKSKSLFYHLSLSYSLFAVSAITEYEILVGSNPIQDKFWLEFFEQITVLPYNSETNRVAIKIYRQLKSQNKLIDIPDLFIGATAVQNKLSLATLNSKHFTRIADLNIIFSIAII